MRKIGLLSLSLSLIACGTGGFLPEFPEVHQCVFKSESAAFYCVNKKTGKRVKVSVGHEWADGMQALPTNDPQRSYQSSEEWVEEVKKLARQRCN